MKSHNVTVRRIASLAVIAAVIGAALTFAPMGVLSQDGDGVTTPAPSGGSDDPYDCGDFDNAQQVRAVFADEAPNDESDLDRDDDNIPCEGQFPDQSEPVTSTPTATATATATSTPTATATPTTTSTTEATETTTEATATPTTTETSAEPTAVQAGNGKAKSGNGKAKSGSGDQK